MTPEEAEQLLGGQPIQFTPGASNVVSQIPADQEPKPPAFNRPTERGSQQEFIERERQPGVNFDITTGASPWERLMLEGRRSRDAQINYLENKYGKDKVRMTENGELIFRVPDLENQGKEKDILAVPHGKLTLSDFLNLTAAMPETGGWILGEKAAVRAIPALAGKGTLRTAGRLGAGALGAETAGALTKDIPASIYDKGTIDFPEILKGRGAQAAADVGVGGALGAGGAFLRFAKAPLAGQREQMQFDAINAAKYLKDKFGVEVPMSVGESTGVPLFMRSEAFVEKEPGGSGPIRKLKGQQENALRRLQGLMMGTSIPMDEEVGQKAINEIQGKIAPIVEGEAARRQATSATAHATLEGLVSGLTYPDRQLYKDELGSEIRQNVIAKRDAQKAEADRLYQIVRELPGGTGRVFNGAPLQKRFDDILNNLPGMAAKGEEITYDQYGNPFTRPTETSKLLEKWPPDKLLARLREITSAKDPKFALSDLVQMRRDIYDDIQRGEGVPELGTRYLSQIGKAITDTIDDTISGLPDGSLKTALNAADKHYKEQVVPFNRLGITELFRDPKEVGFVSNDQVLTRILGGADANRNWDLMKETLGETSPTFQKVKRAVADNIIEPSRLPGENTIDAQSFIKRLSDFKTNNRRIYDEVFSKKEKELFNEARTLQYAQGDKLDAEQLNRLLATPHPSGSQLKTLIAAERKKTDLYRNTLIKSIGDGTVDEATLRPTEFVNRLLSDKGFGLDDTKQLMGLLQGNPQLQEELRQKTLERIFREAARPATAEDITRTASGDNTHILSGVLLNQSLKDKTYRAKVAELLGKDSFDDLQQYIKLTAPLEKKEEAYALAGGLAAGSRVGQLERVLEGRGGLLKFAGNTMRSFVFSYLLSNPASRAYLSRTASSPAAEKTLVMSILTSPPFIQAVAKQFPGVTGARFINNLKTGIENSVGTTPQQQPTNQRPFNAARPLTDDEKRIFWQKQLQGP